MSQLIPRTTGKRRSTRARTWFLAGIGTFVLGAISLSFGLAWRESRSFVDEATGTVAVQPPAATAPLDGLAPASDAAASDAARPIFPYSIIDGGARSVSELEAAINGDPVVAAHYQEFDLSKTRVERLEEPRFAHVSYRVGNDIFWTRKKIQIPRGETVLTDGAHTARTRCGNQVADVPLGPVAPNEPAAAVMDTPIVPPPQPARAAQMAAPLAGVVPSGTAAGGGAPAGSAGSAGGGAPAGSAGGAGGGAPAGSAGGAGGVPLIPAGALGTVPGAGDSSQPQSASSGGSGGAIPPARSPEGVPTPPGGTLPPGISALPPAVPPAGPPVLPEFPENPFTPPGLDEPTNPIVPEPPIDTSGPTGGGQDPEPPVPVPEPGSLTLMLTAAAGFAARQLRAARARRR